MALDTASLEPIIYQILSAPGTDLSTISAKRVRRQLAEEETLTAESIKEHRGEIDALITRIFERVSAEQQQAEDADEPDSDDDSAGEESYTSRKRQHDDDDGEEEDDMGSPPPAKKAKKAKNGSKLSDEALARKLSNEINGRATRTGKAGATKARASTGKAKAKKSAATIDSDEDSDNGSKKRKPKKRASSSTGGGGAKGGFAKEFILSEPLAVVVQAEKMSRPQVVKQLWAYIKDNELQNPNDKREILCDSNLKAVFGKEKVTMFSMNKYLGQNLHEPET